MEKGDTKKSEVSSLQPIKKFIPFVNNFCPRRSLDTSRFYNYFLENGWQPANSIEKSDLIFIYSCGCFGSSEKRTLNTIKAALEKKASHAEIVVTGCLLKIHGDVLNGTYHVIPVEEISSLDNIIAARTKMESIPDANAIYPMRDLISPKDFLMKKFKMDVELSSLFFSKVKSFFFGRTKYRNTWNIKIADGCLGNCSYCAIKFAAGRVKSKDPVAIVQEFKQGVQRGEKTFVLINNDVGSYGQDIGTNFAELMEKIFDIEGRYKIRIIDFNPRWLIRYFERLLPLFKKNKDKIAYLSMPVQSASDKTLRLMRRPYKIDDIKFCFNELKKNIPDLVINTHFIVGFPGETDDDFELTREYAQAFEFGRISIHPYNDRPGTESSKMPDKIPVETMFKRYRKLLQIS
ncbi:MAG: radical SAM protein [Candidatus Aminicenantes bacterium]|nr:radical SAM protein [Candidatus Aminicenantes bacterium]